MRERRKLKLLFDIAERYALESTCPRLQSGAIIFSKDFHQIESGYNGAPHGVDQCDEVGCLIIDNHCARACHAETNALVLAGRDRCEGQNMVMTHFPCVWCARLIIQTGIRKIYWKNLVPSYNEEHRRIVVEAFSQVGVEHVQWWG